METDKIGTYVSERCLTYSVSTERRGRRERERVLCLYYAMNYAYFLSHTEYVVPSVHQHMAIFVVGSLKR